MILGVSLCSGAMFLASAAPSFVLFILCNVLYGVGVPIVGMSTLAMLWSHFPERKGMISGLLLSALVLSSSLSSLVLPYLINPRNQSPDLVISHGVVTNHLYSEEVASRLPFTMKGLGLLYLAYGVLAVPLYLPIKRSENNFLGSFEDNKCGDLRTALRHKVFWCMFGLGCLSSCNSYAGFGLYMSSVCKNFGQEVISDDRFFTYVNMTNSVCSALFRIGCAALMDKFGFHRVFLGILGLQLVLGYVYFLTRASPVLFLLASGLGLGLEGGIVATLLSLCGEMFGKQMGVKVYSVLYSCFISSLVFTIVLQSVLLTHIGYFLMFAIVTSFNWLSLLLLLRLPKVCPWALRDKSVLIEFTGP